jgi:hypothetical protein
MVRVVDPSVLDSSSKPRSAQRLCCPWVLARAQGFLGKERAGCQWQSKGPRQ